VQLGIGDRGFLKWAMGYASGNWALYEVGHLVGAVLEVDVEALLSYVDLPIGKPAMEMEVIHCESGLGEPVPSNLLGLFLPISNWIIKRALEGSLVRSAVSTEST
jgi:hypothetical protein